MEGNKEAKQLGVTWIGSDIAGAWQVYPLGTQDSSGEAARRNHTQGSPLLGGRKASFSAQIPPASYFPSAKFHPIGRNSLYFQPLPAIQ